jgi:hypothetical protein
MSALCQKADIQAAIGYYCWWARVLVRGSSPVKLTRRRFLHLTVGAAAIPAFSRTASAETYPTRPAIGHNCGPPMDELPATPGQDLRGMPRDLSCYYGCLPARQF